jgi:bifunctional non-homologous end joining protein LigD
VQRRDLYEIKSPLILQPGPAALTDGLEALRESSRAGRGRLRELFLSGLRLATGESVVRESPARSPYPALMPRARSNPAIRVRPPSRTDLSLVSPCHEPPAGDGWLHEVKHDGHRLVAMFDGRGGLRLISRNGYNRTATFRAPFDSMLGAVGHDMILDGEIAVPDERGVTHISDLQDARIGRRPERLAYFAFDLLRLDSRDLRGLAVEDRKAQLRDALGPVGGGRVVYVDRVVGRGAELFERVWEIGAEGIVSKRLGSPYRAGRSSDWLKTKCYETAEFVIVGFVELGDGRLDGLSVAEVTPAGDLVPRGIVKFGFAGMGLWQVLDTIRTGPPGRGGVVPVKPLLIATVKFFGRFKQGGAIRDGVLIGMPRMR